MIERLTDEHLRAIVLVYDASESETIGYTLVALAAEVMAHRALVALAPEVRAHRAQGLLTQGLNPADNSDGTQAPRK